VEIAYCNKEIKLCKVEISYCNEEIEICNMKIENTDKANE
jgi:hypothetical protein